MSPVDPATPPELGTTRWHAIRARVARTAASVGVATGAYGLSYGALATTAGLSVPQTCATSLLIFTGGSQFALIGVLGAGGSGVSGTASAVLLGSRNLVYGASIARLLGLHGPRRLVGAQLVIDESTAVALGSQATAEGDTTERPLADRAGRLGFWATGLAVFLLWNASTLVGALAGSVIGDPRTFGLDAAAPAAFLALLAPRLRGRPAWTTAVVAALVAIAVVPLVPAGVPVLVAALVPVVAVLAQRSAPGAAS